MNEKNGKGFTFVEVEVSITLIFMAITGLGVLTVNGVKQLQALEKANPRVTMVSPDYSAAVTSIIYSPQNPRSDWYVVTLNSVSKSGARSFTNWAITSGWTKSN